MGTAFSDSGSGTAYDADGLRAFQSPPIVTAVEDISTAVLARLKKSGGTMTGDLTLAGDPTSALHAATKQYVDSVATTSSYPKDPVNVATTANITLSGEQTIDGVLTSGSRVLVKNQSTGSQNGIYVSASGSWTRATDADANNEIQQGTSVLVLSGSSLSGTSWYCTTSGSWTVGSTATTWVQTTAAAAVADGSVTTAKIADSPNGVTTAKLSDDAVTFAKMQNITTDRLLGRDTASSGNIEELSVTNGLEFTGSTGLQTVAWVRARPDRATVFQTGGTTYAVNGSGTLITSAATTAGNNVTVINTAIDTIKGTYNASGHAGGGVCRLADQNFATNAYIDLLYGVSLVGWAAFDRNGLTGAAHSLAGTTITPTGITTVDVDGGATTANRNPAILAGRGVSGSGTQSTTNPHGCGITGVNIDMRAVTSGQGIVIADTQFFYVDRCNITGANASGGRGVEVYSTNSPDDGAHGTRITNSMIAYCYVGVYGSGSGSTDSFVEGSRILQCVNKGIQLGAAGGGGGWQIANNHITTGTTTSCDHIESDAPANILNNYLDTCGGYHIILNGPATVMGNVIKANSGAADGASLFAPITMGNGGGRASTIMGNVAQLKDTTYVALVQIDSTTGDLYRPVITGNVLMTGGAAMSYTGIACNGSGAAIGETNAAMTVSTTGANPYIYGNRIIANSGF